jgi:hypothetical protein
MSPGIMENSELLRKEASGLQRAYSSKDDCRLNNNLRRQKMLGGDPQQQKIVLHP